MITKKYIRQHLGLGDHIICNGLVRYFCEKHIDVVLFCSSIFYENVKYMFRDLKNLEVIFFEYQPGKGAIDSIKLKGFDQMMKLTSKLQKGGVNIVVGSHGMVPYAEKGWAYQREMELFVESGMSNSAVIHAATMVNARFFKIEKELGSIEKGKLADMILVRGNPLEDIKVMRNIERVMINGVFVK